MSASVRELIESVGVEGRRRMIDQAQASVDYAKGTLLAWFATLGRETAGDLVLV